MKKEKRTDKWTNEKYKEFWKKERKKERKKENIKIRENKLSKIFKSERSTFITETSKTYIASITSCSITRIHTGGINLCIESRETS